MIRVLALNDDNHDVVYVGKLEYFGTAEEFIEKLMQPHTEEYEVRGIFAPDYEGEIAGFTEAFDTLFLTYNVKEGIGDDHKKYLERADIFDAMWDLAEEV